MDEDSVLAAVRRAGRPIKAREIALEHRADRNEVNRVLFVLKRRGLVEQNEYWAWVPSARHQTRAEGGASVPTLPVAVPAPSAPTPPPRLEAAPTAASPPGAGHAGRGARDSPGFPASRGLPESAASGGSDAGGRFDPPVERRESVVRDRPGSIDQVLRGAIEGR